MGIFWIIYILGVIATLFVMYCTLEKGHVVKVAELLWDIVVSSISWIAFFIILVFTYGDREVFKKK